MDRLLIITLIIFLILSCVTISDQIDFLDNEISRIFPDRNYTDYIVGENKKKLEKIDDMNLYLNTLYDMLKTKVVANSKYFSDKEEFAYKVTEILEKITDYIIEDKKDNKNIILKILIKINNKFEADYVHNFLHGMYKGYYVLLKKIKDDVDQENVNAFINTLPTLKMVILSEYMFLLNYNQNPNVKAFYHAYENANMKNYKNIFSSKKIFLYTTKEQREEYVENIGYYFKLKEFIE